MAFKVLYVDKEPDFLNQAKIYLEKNEELISINTTLSSKDALKMLEEDEYDVLVSSYPCPEMGGLKLLREIRESGNDIPFIIFTGRSREEIAIRALNLGADRFLERRGDPQSQYKILADAIAQEAESRKLKKELEKSEEKYRALTEKSLVGVYIIQENEFKYVNPEFCKIFGYNKDGLIGKNYLELVSPKDRGLVREGVEKRQKREGEENRYSFRGQTKKGTDMWVEVFSVPSTYKGKPAVQGTLINITERKKAEERFRSFFEKIPIMGFIINEKGIVEEVNDTYCEKTGYRREDIVGKPLDEIPETLSKKDRKRTLKRFKRIVNGEKLSPITAGYITEKGESRYLEMNSIRYRKEDGSVIVVGFARDTTERKKAMKRLEESEKRFRSFFEANPDPTYIIDRNGTFREANSALCELIGYSKKEIEGTHFKNLGFLPEKSIKKTEKNFKKRLKGKEVDPYTIEVTTKNGKTKFVEIRGTPIEKTGEITEEIGIAIDVTEDREKSTQKS